LSLSNSHTNYILGFGPLFFGFVFLTYAFLGTFLDVEAFTGDVSDVDSDEEDESELVT